VLFSQFAKQNLKRDVLEVGTPEENLPLNLRLNAKNYAAFASGITPVMSILKSVLKNERVLLYWFTETKHPKKPSFIKNYTI
jgi:ferredoxin-NADP reductase